MSKRMWEAVKTKAEKTGIAKTKERRDKRGSREEIRRKSKEIEKEAEKRKDYGSKESGGRTGDLG